MRELTEAAAGAVAREIATLRREAIREREVRDAQFAARVAELETRIAAVSEIERRLTERMAALKDGEPGRDGTNGRDGASVSVDDVLPAILARADAAVAENVERVLSGWERPKDGASVSVADVAPVLRDLVAALPKAKDGKDGADADPEVIRSMVAEAIAGIPVPQDGRDGSDGSSVTADDVMPVLEARLAELVAAIPVPKDGKDGLAGKDADPEVTAALVREEVGKAMSAIPTPKDGTSVTVDDVAPLIVEEVERRMGEHASALSRQMDEAVAAIPVPKDGIDGKDGAPGKDGLDGKDGDRGPEGPIGKLPAVKEWTDGVFYEGAVVTRDGGVYQAKRDTGKEPGHDDWLCIVERGKDGSDGRSFTVCGTYMPEAEYHALDVVALNGASFAAKRDNPGECPGDGWQMIAMQGRQGKPGQSIKGERGPPGPGLHQMSIDDNGLLVARNADGSEVECDLYPVLSRLG